jgi:hypothetical protein
MIKWLFSTRERIWKENKKACLFLLGVFVIALYAPLIVTGAPLFIDYRSHWYFPLFHSYFSSCYFSPYVDIPFNILGIFFPFLFFLFVVPSKFHWIVPLIILKKIVIFSFFAGCIFYASPLNLSDLEKMKRDALVAIEEEQYTLALPKRPPYPLPSFSFDLKYMDDNAKLLSCLQAQEMSPDGEFLKFLKETQEKKAIIYNKLVKEERRLREKHENPQRLHEITSANIEYEKMERTLAYYEDKKVWAENEKKQISHLIMLPFSAPLYSREVSSTLVFFRNIVYGMRVALILGGLAAFLSLFLRRSLTLVYSVLFVLFLIEEALCNFLGFAKLYYETKGAPFLSFVILSLFGALIAKIFLLFVRTKEISSGKAV